MEKVAGKELSHVWGDFTGKQKYSVVQQIVQFEQKFPSTRFSAYGNLYYADDLLPGELARILHLYTNASGVQTNTKFAVGPTNSRIYFDDGRSDVAVDRGPWKSASDYAIASAPPRDCLH
ncbi:hypothetical protein AJ79_09969 [Helicocarpus griseus UAMH5409]|uniref:Uncharacterized protein n=1 Tax=Helicocarpus griseus UAMH5409 TaxID=1447875 RepID=A0A2B7WG70_9EURO|nr:hypothetical protein AJ79_09969 [Helicocarpus griseus UAMH5409]